MADDPIMETSRQVREVADKATVLVADAVDAVIASEQFSAAMGWYMTGIAFASSTARGVTHRITDVAADWMNMPTRDQLTDVAKRITRLELAVDDIEMGTETLQQMVADQHADD